jgi:hypothetical protein
MRLIAQRQGRNDKLDLLRCIRRDGSETSTAMPRQGILPHDPGVGKGGQPRVRPERHRATMVPV